MTFWVHLVPKNWDGALIDVARYFWQQLANRPMTRHAQLFAPAETLALESADWFEDRVFVFFPPPRVEPLPRRISPGHFGLPGSIHETLDWQPDERVAYRSFCFPSPPRHIYAGRFRMAKQSQWRVTPAFVNHKYSPAKAQSPERVVSSRAVLAVSAYCLQHLTARRRASCSGVKFAGPQKCDIVLCTQKRRARRLFY